MPSITVQCKNVQRTQARKSWVIKRACDITKTMQRESTTINVHQAILWTRCLAWRRASFRSARSLFSLRLDPPSSPLPEVWLNFESYSSFPVSTCFVVAAKSGGGSKPKGRALVMSGGAAAVGGHVGGEDVEGDVRLPNKSDRPDDSGNPVSTPEESSSELSCRASSELTPGLFPNNPIRVVFVETSPPLSSDEDSVSLLILSREANLLLGRESKLFFFLTGCSLGGVGRDYIQHTHTGKQKHKLTRKP